MSGHTREEVTEEWSVFHHEIHNLLLLPNIIRTIPSIGDAMGGTEQHEGEKRQNT
jgi:hypothetical protein